VLKKVHLRRETMGKRAHTAAWDVETSLAVRSEEETVYQGPHEFTSFFYVKYFYATPTISTSAVTTVFVPN